MAGSKEYLGVRGTEKLTKLVKSALGLKQDVLTGNPDDILLFDSTGKLVSSGEIKALYDLIKDV